MYINEIIKEESLNEALPAAIPLTLSAIMLGLKALSVYQIYTIMDQAEFNIDNLSEQDYLDIIVNAILLFIPGGRAAVQAVMSKTGTAAATAFNNPKVNQAVLKLLPEWFKKRAVSIVKDKIAANRTQLKAKLKSAKKNPATQSQVSAQAINQFKTASTKYLMSAAGGQLYKALKYLGATALFVKYGIELYDIEDQYKKYQSGDMTTERYLDADPQTAFEAADHFRKKALGELVISLTALIAAAPASRVLKLFGDAIGMSRAPGSAVVSKIFNIPANLLMAGPVLAAAMQTPQGEKFLANILVEAYTVGFVGNLTSAALSLLSSAISSVSPKLGSAISTNVVNPTTTAAQSSAASNIPRELRVRNDPSNPKIMFVGNVQITDQDGYQSVGDRYLNSIRRSANANGVQDPTAGIPKRPGKNYNY
jgi:hypothetical protein